MKRKTAGICIFIAVPVILAAVFAGVFKKQGVPVPETGQQTKAESEIGTEEAVYSSKTEEPYRYIIFEEDGRLTVFESDNQTRYLDTGISAETLPEELKEKLETGIRFQTEEELFAFLESYSS